VFLAGKNPEKAVRPQGVPSAADDANRAAPDDEVKFQLVVAVGGSPPGRLGAQAVAEDHSVFPGLEVERYFHGGIILNRKDKK
jgi:hypothetical protein